MLKAASVSGVLALLLACGVVGCGVKEKNGPVEGHVRSADGVVVAYSALGAGDTALVLIHGGLADREFWRPQLEGLSDRFRVAALDLAGHGKSGRNRTEWTIPAWAGDVLAVVETLDLRRVVLVGNSLGGPVALEAAALLRGRAIGVVGVDTLHNALQQIPADAAAARAAAFRDDYAGACRAMIDSMFHPGAYPELRAWTEQRLLATPAAVAIGMMASFTGYDLAAAFRGAGVPIRAINGDLWPTLVDGNRTVVPDFDAVIMKGAGHYPMLERPEEFNRLLVEVVGGLVKAVPPPA